MVLDEVVLVETCPSVEATMLGRERIARMSMCPSRLSEKTRVIFLSHRVDGMTYKEIAREHQLSVCTIEKLVAKATVQVTTWMEGWELSIGAEP